MTKRIMAWMAGLVLLGVGFGLGEEKKSSPTEAIKCWWKTDRNAVQFGQPFNLTLTCQLANSVSTQTVMEDERLEGVGTRLTPFEVVAVKKFQDLAGESLRFVQYQYTLRLMADGLWGKDAAIPALEIRYRLRHAVKNGEMLVGQPRVYLMPAYPVRIISLVPKGAKDIRDAGLENFGYREAVASRGRFFLIAAAALSGLALVIFLGMAVNLVRRWLVKKPVAENFFSRRALLRRLLREWKKTKKARVKQGWTSDLLIRAITVLRIAGAVSLEKAVPQAAAPVEERGLEGQLKLRRGLFWPKKILVSSCLTPEEMSQAIHRSDRYGKVLRELSRILERFSAVRYSRDQYLDALVLDEGLGQGLAVLKSVRFYNYWAVKKSLSAKKKITIWWGRLWIRS